LRGSGLLSTRAASECSCVAAKFLLDSVETLSVSEFLLKKIPEARIKEAIGGNLEEGGERTNRAKTWLSACSGQRRPPLVVLASPVE
jgi:hypothetical protein